MKRYLPLILVGVGILVLGAVFFLVRGRKAEEPQTSKEETALLDVALEDRPVVSLTPTSDGHYLNLKIEKMLIPASSLDYELIYKNAQGVTQGVPGTVDLQGKDSFAAELLLGSESSGKFRYDEGVEEGTLTLGFRNSEGKLLVKFSSDFHLQTNTKELSSLDGNFEFVLGRLSTKTFYVVMPTIGYPGSDPGRVVMGPYGIFSSSGNATGRTKIKDGVLLRSEKEGWERVSGNVSEGVFVGVGE